MVIVWNNTAKNEFRKAYQYIAGDSFQNAENFKKEMVAAILALTEFPERYRTDKYKKNNDGTWRAFEKHRYRISYRILKNEIRIVRMRHTSRSPLMY